MVLLVLELKEIPRLALSVKPAVAARVPPFMTKSPGVAEPGAAPKLLSMLTLSVPPVIVVVPV